MITGQQLIDAGDHFRGQYYDQSEGRDSPYTLFKDCSGLIAASFELAYTLWGGGRRLLGANISVTIYDLCKTGVGGSRIISRDEAFNIAGACLLEPDNPDNGWGNDGHIGFVRVPGQTSLEATPPRVQELPLTYERWAPIACLLPWVDYSGGSQQVSQPPKRQDVDQMIVLNNRVLHLMVAKDGTLVCYGEVNGSLYPQKNLTPAGMCDPTSQIKSIYWEGLGGGFDLRSADGGQLVRGIITPDGRSCAVWRNTQGVYLGPTGV